MEQWAAVRLTLSRKQVSDRANRMTVLLALLLPSLPMGLPLRPRLMVMMFLLKERPKVVAQLVVPLTREPCRCPNRLPIRWPVLAELKVLQVLGLDQAMVQELVLAQVMAQEPGAAQGLVPEVDQVEKPEPAGEADQAVELAVGPVLVVVAKALAVVLVWQVLHHRRNAPMASRRPTMSFWR